jgi:AraC-like DNA-binding protein
MDSISFEVVQPIAELKALVESFWILTNQTDDKKPAIILPDGRLDVSFAFANRHNLGLHGLETEPSQVEIAPRFSMFSISFRPLAAEYLFKGFLPILPDSLTLLPADYFGVAIEQFRDIRQFSGLLTEALLGMIKADIDPRKKNLFDLIYASNGAISVKELSEKICWSSRQINRYFQDTFGLSLKTYCNVMRFRSSFGHIKAGKLFPEENYADQSHFIREIRKYSGVVPKELARNRNDRFIQFSTLPAE